MENHNAMQKSSVKLTAYFEKYERFGTIRLVILHVARKNAKEAVTALISNMGLYAEDFEDLLIGADEGITDPPASLGKLPAEQHKRRRMRFRIPHKK